MFVCRKEFLSTISLALGSVFGERSFPHQTPQYLGDLKIEEVRGMQGFVMRINPLLDALSGRGLKKPVQCGPTHLGRSPKLSLFSHQASGIKLKRKWFTLMQTLPQLCERWPLRDFFDLRQQIIRKRFPRHVNASLQATMQAIRYVTKLNHLRHVVSIEEKRLLPTSQTTTVRSLDSPVPDL
jgi:hypothetical protein